MAKASAKAETETRVAGPVRSTKDGAFVKLRVSPGAKSTTVKGPYGEHAVKLSVAAPPVDGKANAEVLRFLSGLFGVPRSDVELVSGASGRDKTILVRGATGRNVRARLSYHL